MLRQSEIEFDGKTYVNDLDQQRLSGQLLAVHSLMSDHQWRTLAEIVCLLGKGSETGVSARLRDLRKPRFGSLTVESRRRQPGGLWEYRITESGNAT
jgi:hypothetical protein